jgi:SAM-dependent methyltransferase
VTSGPAEWEWDPTLFAGAAPYYDRGRLPYAPGLVDAFAATFALDGTDRLLDVGCGPGTVALRLAHIFREVVGVDADAEMLTEAGRLASERQVDNAHWIQLRAEQLPDELGEFRIVTFAASFHWMDRAVVAAAVRRMLAPGGAVVHVDGRHQHGLGPVPELPSPPREEMGRLRRDYLGEDRRAGAGIRNASPDDEARVFREAGYAGPDVVLVPDGRVIERSIDDLVAETFSMSSSAPHLFGARVGEFEADLRRLLSSAAPAGRFGEQLPDNHLYVWRPVS